MLTHGRPTEDFSALLLQLKSKSEEDRKNATKALGKMAISGERHVVRPLIRLLSSPDHMVRFNACEAIGNIGEPRAFKSLINLLKDEDQWVRESACRGLERIADVRAIEPLLERLSDTFDKVRDTALTTLKSLGCGRLGKAILNQNLHLLLKIAKEGDPRAVDKILEIFRKNMDDKQFCADLKPQLLSLHKEYSKSYHQFLCIEHLHRFEEFTDPDIKIGFRKKLPYYACRKCKKTIYCTSGIRQVVAILDSKCKFEVAFDSDKYLVNYLSLNRLFDFNRIEITRTTDKAIEQFCYRITQDTDPYRKQRYSKIPCLVSPNSGISDWSKKILKDMFKNINLTG